MMNGCHGIFTELNELENQRKNFMFCASMYNCTYSKNRSEEILSLNVQTDKNNAEKCSEHETKQ